MKDDPLPSHTRPGKIKKIFDFLKNLLGVIFKFAINTLSKLFLNLETLKFYILDIPKEIVSFLRSINIRSLQSNSNRTCNQILSFKYFQHLGILLVFILVLINHAFAGDTDRLGKIELSFESEAGAKFLTDADLVEIVKTIDKYTILSENPEALPENLDKDRKIILDQRGFIIKPVLAMGTIENQEDSTSAVSGERKENIEYAVKEGETLGGIAQSYALKITTLKFANNLSDIDTILPGQKLLIPFADGMMHTVKAGETLLGIVKRYQGDFQKTLAENDLNEEGTIYIGQKILVVGGKYIPPKPAPSKSTKRRYARGEYYGPRGNFRFPTTGGTYYNGYHWWAIDIPRSTGTSVYASDGGRVVTAGWNSGGYGRYVVINHGNSYTTLYAHFSSINVGVGQYVNQGQRLGGIGCTGRCTGSHLHFEIILNGRKLNPIKFF